MMPAPALLRQLGIRFIESALEKAAADNRPGDAKPPVGANGQALSLGSAVNQLQETDAENPIKEENAPRVLTPQQ